MQNVSICKTLWLSFDKVEYPVGGKLHIYQPLGKIVAVFHNVLIKNARYSFTKYDASAYAARKRQKTAVVVLGFFRLLRKAFYGKCGCIRNFCFAEQALFRQLGCVQCVNAQEKLCYDIVRANVFECPYSNICGIDRIYSENVVYGLI